MDFCQKYETLKFLSYQERKPFMFAKYNSTGFISPIDGIEMKTFVYGEKSLLTRFHLKKGSLLPLHSHPHEQTGFMVSGRMRLFIGKDGFTAEAGDSWSINGNIEHRAEILEDSVAIEVFSPVREDYLPV